MRMRAMDYTALTIVLIGALSWALVGFFHFDLVAALFGNMTLLTRLLYCVVGVAGLYCLSFFGRIGHER